MSNHHFHFKQFSIHQDKTAMKVCTDACLFGAWLAEKAAVLNKGALHMLDIGTGTGLLSLMIAQKVQGEIDAVEIDHGASVQARENAAQSPWKDRIHIYETALKDFSPAVRYDLIFSNPPFYENDLRSPDSFKNAAMHDSSLKLDELILFISKNLNETGIAGILIPYKRTEYLESLVIKSGMFIRHRIFIRQTPGHDFFRSVLLLSKQESENHGTESLIIYDENRQYTPAFISLLKDYYLKL